MSEKEAKQLSSKILKSCKKEFISKFVISLLVRITLLIIPILYSDIVDAINDKAFQTAYFMVAFSIVVTLLSRLFEVINQHSFYKLYNKLYDRYTKEAIDSTYQNSMFSLTRFNLGEYTNILNNDIDVIAGFYSNGVMRAIQILEFVYIFIYFYFVSPIICFITVIVTVIAVLLNLFYGKTIQKYNKLRKDTLDSKAGTVHEWFYGLNDIKGFRVFSQISDRLTKRSRNYLGANADYNIKYETNKYVSILLIELFRLILFGYGIYLLTQGQMALGILLIIYNYYQKIIDNFSTISTINVEFRNLKVSFSRFYKILEYRHMGEQGNTILLDQTKGAITFDHVLYGYKNDPILNDVSFFIPENSITVITGRPGSGKTGVFDLLLRLNQQHEGTVMIDHIDINMIDEGMYYNYVSSVRKNPKFFEMSIKDNLMMMESDFNKVKELSKLLKIDDDIEKLKNGYDTIMGDSASGITSSLRILLAIERVLLMNSKIMLFDETISFLDKSNQDLVLGILMRLKKEHTIVIISREKTILKYADQVIGIDGNKVANVTTKKPKKNCLVREG